MMITYNLCYNKEFNSFYCGKPYNMMGRIVASPGWCREPELLALGVSINLHHHLLFLLQGQHQ